MINDEWDKDIVTSILNRQPVVTAQSVRVSLISSHPTRVQFLFVIKRIAAHLLHPLCVASQLGFQQSILHMTSWHKQVKSTMLNLEH